MSFENLERATLPVRYTVDSDFSSERFVKMRLAICHDGKNLNNTFFTVSEFEDAAPSLPYSPLLAYVQFDENGEPQFTGHETHIEFDNDGYREFYDETPIGVIPENCNYAIEEIEGKNWVCADAYVWRAYSNYALDIVERDSYVPLSMEIDIKDYEFHKASNSYRILKFQYLGVTFCGDPDKVAMQGAHAVPAGNYSAASKKFFTTLTEALREELTTTQEGGTSLEDVKNPVEEEFEQTEGTEPEPTTEFEEENIKTPEPETDPEPQDESGTEDSGEDASENYQLQSHILESVYEALSGIVFDWDGYACQKYHFTDMDATNRKIYVWNLEDGRIYSVDYTLDGDKLTLGKDYKRQVVEYRDYVDGAPESTFALSKFTKDLRTEYEAKIKEMNTELEQYRVMSEKAELEKKEAAVAALFAQFEDLENVEEFTTLKKTTNDNLAASDLGALELQCYALRGKQVKTNYSKEQSGRQVLPKTGSENNQFVSGSRSVLEHFFPKNKKG